MKSKASATPMSAMTARRLASIRSGVLDDDALEDVGDVLAAIGGLFEEVQDLLPFHDDDGVLFILEQRRHGGLMGAVRLVLEAGDLDGALPEPLSLFPGPYCRGELHPPIPGLARQASRPLAGAVRLVKTDR